MARGRYEYILANCIYTNEYIYHVFPNWKNFFPYITMSGHRARASTHVYTGGDNTILVCRLEISFKSIRK